MPTCFATLGDDDIHTSLCGLLRLPHSMDLMDRENFEVVCSLHELAGIAPSQAFPGALPLTCLGSVA